MDEVTVFKYTLWSFVAAIALTLPAIFIADVLLSAECHARSGGEQETRYRWLSGCHVKSGDIFVPQDRIWYERND